MNATKRKTEEKAKPPKRPPSDRGQGRKTIDPSGEPMAKRNIRATDAQWETQRRRGHFTWRQWLAMTDEEFDEYVALRKRQMKRSAKAAEQ